MRPSFTNFEYCPTLARLMSSGEVILPNGSSIAAQGISTPNNLHVLRRLLLHEKPARTLEVGLAAGASALVFLASHQDNKSIGEHPHTAIDAYQSSYCQNAALHLTAEAGLAHYLRIFEDLSCIVLPELLKNEEEFDVVYVDGSHSFPNVFVDFYYCSQMLALDGIILFDDCSDPNVTKVCSFIDRNLGEWLHPVSLAPYRIDQGRSFKFMIGKLIGKLQLRAYRLVKSLPEYWSFRFRNF